MAARKKILYIEDDTASRMLVNQILSDKFEIYEADTGIIGLHRAARIIPDLILIDLQLPDMSGTELASKLRTIKALEATVIVALTGDRKAYGREISLVAGCDGYLQKPIDLTNFEKHIDEFLEGKREKLPDSERSFLRNSIRLILLKA